MSVAARSVIHGCVLRIIRLKLPRAMQTRQHLKERFCYQSIERRRAVSGLISYDLCGFICSVGLIHQAFSSDIMLYVSFSYLLRFGPYIEMLYSKRKKHIKL